MHEILCTVSCWFAMLSQNEKAVTESFSNRQISQSFYVAQIESNGMQIVNHLNNCHKRYKKKELLAGDLENGKVKYFSKKFAKEPLSLPLALS